jgi:hypothetical protein
MQPSHPSRRLAFAITLAAAALLADAGLRAQTAEEAHAHPHADMMEHAGAKLPTLPGQDAFGAIQEIVRIMEADPATDWSKADLEALREHLVDMEEVTLRAEAAAQPVEGGIAVAVTGGGRTLDAIRRMVPAHAGEIERTRLNGWRAGTEAIADGVRLTVTADDPREVAHVRGLGFIGIMASGHHHQPHHLAIARGEPVH